MLLAIKRVEASVLELETLSPGKPLLDIRIEATATFPLETLIDCHRYNPGKDPDRNSNCETRLSRLIRLDAVV